MFNRMAGADFSRKTTGDIMGMRRVQMALDGIRFLELFLRFPLDTQLGLAWQTETAQSLAKYLVVALELKFP
jgi:hypothetical protein